MTTPPLVAIVVLNWNGCEDTLMCLESLSRLDYPACAVVVVDNGSTDGSVAAIRTRWPGAELVETGSNLGYVGGNNAGIDRARSLQAEYVLLLNNDTEVAADMVSRLMEVAQSDPAIGVVGPTIYYFEERDVVWSAGGAIDWSQGSTRMLGLDETDRGQFGTAPRSVDFVTGCALLARVAVWDRAGALDPRFFAYYEETEWCVRVARAGFKILHVPAARMWHKISASARGASPAVHYYMTRNRLLFLGLTGAGWRAWFHTLALDYLRTALSWSLRPRWRAKRRQRDMLLRAVLDYFTGRTGRGSFQPG